MHLYLSQAERTESPEPQIEDDIFAPSECLSKPTFMSAWDGCKKEFTFPLGKLTANCEGSIIRRLQKKHIMGTAIRMYSNRIVLYFAGLSVEGVMIYLLVEVNKSTWEGCVVYKTQEESRRNNFELYMMQLLGSVPEIAGR